MVPSRGHNLFLLRGVHLVMEKKILSVVVALAALTAFLCHKDDMLIQKQTARYYDTAAENAQSVLLLDLDTDERLYEKNPAKRVSIGSVNKVLTTCIAMEYLDWDDLFTVGDEIGIPYITWDASRCLLKKGQVVSFRHLMIGAMLPSGCDAINVMAVNVVRKVKNDPDIEIGKAISLFCDMMNSYAQSLGCTASHFVNADGQDDPRQYTCVNDALLFIRKAMENETFLEIVKMPYADVQIASGEQFQWINTNQLLDPDSPYYYPNALGLKTGYTIAAGYVMAAYAKQDGHTLLVLACECAYEWQRYTVASNLLKLGFMSYYQNR